MGYLGLVGTAVVNASATVKATTVLIPVPAGSTVIGGMTVESAAGTIPVISTLVDSRGNTWTTTPDISYGAGGNVTVAGVVVRGTIATALQVGDTITMTISVARVRWALQYDAFNDLIASPKDVAVASNNPGSATILTTGATATTTQAYDLVYAIFGMGSARSPVVQDTWSGTASVETAAGSADRALQCVYRYVGAAGAQTAPLVLGVASTYGAAVCTYKAAYKARPGVLSLNQSVNRAGTY